jgi:hypothetical protein
MQPRSLMLAWRTYQSHAVHSFHDKWHPESRLVGWRIWARANNFYSVCPELVPVE